MRPLWIRHELGIGDGRLALASTGLPSCASRQLHAIDARDPPRRALALGIGRLLDAAPAQVLPVPRLACHVSAPWMRYLVIPWQDGLFRETDREAYARVMLEQRFGAFDAPMRLRVMAGGFARPLLAAAMPQELHDALAAGCASAGFRLSRVMPMLMTAYNRHRLRLPLSITTAEHLFVLLEHGYATFLFFGQGTWSGVITLPCSAAAGFGGLLNQAAVLCDLKLPRQIHVCGSGEAPPSLSLPPGFSCKWLGVVKSRLWQESDIAREGVRHAGDLS